MKLNRLTLYVLLSALIPCIAFGMQSSSYKIPTDSINVGGANSSSGSFTIQDTVGEQATGYSSSANYQLAAGYQQMLTSYIAISSPGNVTLSSINGLSGGSATSSIAWNVTTDNAAGYSLAIQASTSPALQSANSSFADYTPASTSTPDFTFSISPSASAFGFSPEGTDILAKYKDNGSTCNAGSLDTANACWDGFSTTSKIISQSSGDNQPNGATTTLKIQAVSGSSHIQANGSYSAYITVTAVTL